MARGIPTRDVITLVFLFQILAGKIGCNFFAYSWKIPAYSGAFLLTIDNFSLLITNWNFIYNFSVFCL